MLSLFVSTSSYLSHYIFQHPPITITKVVTLTTFFSLFSLAKGKKNLPLIGSKIEPWLSFEAARPKDLESGKAFMEKIKRILYYPSCIDNRSTPRTDLHSTALVTSYPEGSCYTVGSSIQWVNSFV